jgi:hypothetical protein
MEASRDLAERLRIRRTLTAVCLKERLLAYRNQKEQQLLGRKSNPRKQSLPTHPEQKYVVNEEGTQK